MTTIVNRFVRNRRRFVIAASIILVVAVMAGGTLAYFTSDETAYNVITTGNLDVTLHEETTDGKPFPKEGISGVVPGEKVDKKVYLSNEGNVGMYVRIGLETIYNPDTLSPEYVSLDINDTNWIEQEGYYYYERELMPGEETEPLFTQVSFAASMPNDYQNCKIEIVVSAQAVQSRNNTDSALTAAGWNK